MEVMSLTREDVNLIGEIVALGSSASLDRSPKKNWVEEAGGLPPFVREVARAIEKDGHTLDQAIRIAIGRIKVWAAKGNAKAIKALAQWEALKAKSHAKSAGKAVAASAVELAADNKPYGDVKYADPKNGKYPIDTEAHVRAAWAYINMPKNAATYPLNGVSLAIVKARIKEAARKMGIHISEDSGDTAKMSALAEQLMELSRVRQFARRTKSGKITVVDAHERAGIAARVKSIADMDMSKHTVPSGKDWNANLKGRTTMRGAELREKPDSESSSAALRTALDDRSYDNLSDEELADALESLDLDAFNDRTREMIKKFLKLHGAAKLSASLLSPDLLELAQGKVKGYWRRDPKTGKREFVREHMSGRDAAKKRLLDSLTKSVQAGPGKTAPVKPLPAGSLAQNMAVAAVKAQAPTPLPSKVPTKADLDAAIKAGQRLAAVKIYRAVHGTNLNTAAEAVKKLMPLSPDTKSAEAKPEAKPADAKAGEIKAGKYHVKGGRAVGKAHMIVKDDGTGTYVNSRGESKPLTAAAVKRQFAAGMNHDPGDSGPSQQSLTEKTAAKKASEPSTSASRLADLRKAAQDKNAPASVKEAQDLLAKHGRGGGMAQDLARMAAGSKASDDYAKSLGFEGFDPSNGKLTVNGKEVGKLFSTRGGYVVHAADGTKSPVSADRNSAIKWMAEQADVKTKLPDAGPQAAPRQGRLPQEVEIAKLQKELGPGGANEEEKPDIRARIARLEDEIAESKTSSKNPTPPSAAKTSNTPSGVDKLKSDFETEVGVAVQSVDPKTGIITGSDGEKYRLSDGSGPDKFERVASSIKRNKVTPKPGPKPTFQGAAKVQVNVKSTGEKISGTKDAANYTLKEAEKRLADAQAGGNTRSINAAKANLEKVKERDAKVASDLTSNLEKSVAAVKAKPAPTSEPSGKLGKVIKGGDSNPAVKAAIATGDASKVRAALRSLYPSWSPKQIATVAANMMKRAQ